VTDAVQVVAVIISTALLVFVLDLVRRRKLTEEYSFIWILFAAGQMGLSIWRESLHTVARWLDVHYPPAVLLAALILFVFIASLYFSVVISRQREQIERLVEEQAIVSARLHDLVERRPAATGPEGS
jgi:NO-binding membrane sensor protein with MHYT domain